MNRSTRLLAPPILLVALAACVSTATARRISTLEHERAVMEESLHSVEAARDAAKAEVERLTLAGQDTAAARANLDALNATIAAAQKLAEDKRMELLTAKNDATNERITSGIKIGDGVASVAAPILSILFPVLAPLAGLIQQIFSSLAAARRKEATA